MKQKYRKKLCLLSHTDLKFLTANCEVLDDDVKIEDVGDCELFVAGDPMDLLTLGDPMGLR